MALGLGAVANNIGGIKNAFGKTVAGGLAGFGGQQGSGVDPAIGNDISRFQQLLAQFNPRFLQASDELQGISQGEDPRFEAFRQMRLGESAARNAEFFGRRGTEGSTAALNQGARMQDQISAQLGLAQLERQDQARLSSLDVLKGFLENETIPAQLRIQLQAAMQAGQDNGGGGLLGLGLGPL